MASATESQQAPTAIDPETLVIDTDVHHAHQDIEQLLPYMDQHWQQELSEAFLIGGPQEFQYLHNGPSKTGARLNWDVPGVHAGSDLDIMRRHLFDEEKVSIGIICGLWHVSAMRVNYRLATAWAEAYNDWQIDQWLEKEPRLRGSVHVFSELPDMAAREIDRVAEHRQIVQAYLPLVTDRQYGLDFYRPIFEAAVRNDLAVALHVGAETETAVGYPQFMMEWHTLAAPQAAQSQLASMICNGVFDAFPGLKLVVLEAGVGWVPSFIWKLDEMYNQYRREVPWLKRRPSEYFEDNIRIATQPLADMTPRRFRQVVEMTGSDRVFLFASDYPHFDADTADRVLPSSMPAGLRKRVRYQNALETYPRLAADFA